MTWPAVALTPPNLESSNYTMTTTPSKISQRPCPICREMVILVGEDAKGKKIFSCGHKARFKKTRSQKEMDRKYKETEWGLELIK